jgi:hypothetical protein
MAPGLRLTIGADHADVAAHFAAEYGVATGASVSDAELTVDFRSVDHAAISGGYKTIRWQVGLDARRSTCAGIRGRSACPWSRGFSSSRFCRSLRRDPAGCCCRAPRSRPSRMESR